MQCHDLRTTTDHTDPKYISLPEQSVGTSVSHMLNSTVTVGDRHTFLSPAHIDQRHWTRTCLGLDPLWRNLRLFFGFCCLDSFRSTTRLRLVNSKLSHETPLGTVLLKATLCGSVSARRFWDFRPKKKLFWTVWAKQCIRFTSFRCLFISEEFCCLPFWLAFTLIYYPEPGTGLGNITAGTEVKF
jgi:hypothetical protein